VVLAAIYAAYTAGWTEIGEGGASPLADEAIWLGQLIVSLLPEEPEAKGMLALMLYAEARRAARRGADGIYVPFDDQDIARWNTALIDEAEALLRQANASGPSGRYQLEAAIQSAHAVRRLTGRDTRHAVLALYDHLLALTHSPVAALNRAVALAAIDGAAAALDWMSPLASDSRMLSYQPYWALRGHLLSETERTREAHEALTVAIGLSTDEAVKQYLEDKRESLRRG
jgi:RNA polymerase sigma-70 factor (ECF subfamily)